MKKKKSSVSLFVAVLKIVLPDRAEGSDRDSKESNVIGPNILIK